MTDQFVDINKMVPITPSPELVRQWLKDSPEDDELGISGYIATQAARWGADTELEACCEWVSAISGKYGPRLRTARRPKPPSLKEQGLAALDRFKSEVWCEEVDADFDTIRRALEQLDD